MLRAYMISIGLDQLFEAVLSPLRRTEAGALVKRNTSSRGVKNEKPTFEGLKRETVRVLHKIRV